MVATTTEGIEASPALARAVRARRAELRLSRDELAHHLGWEKGTSYRVGWSPRTIIRIERAERGLEEPERLKAFARALKLTPAQLAARATAAEGEDTGLVPAALALQLEQLEPEAADLVRQIIDDLAALVARLPRGAGDSQNGG